MGISENSFKRTDRFLFSRETLLFLTTLRVKAVEKPEIRKLY